MSDPHRETPRDPHRETPRDTHREPPDTALDAPLATEWHVSRWFNTRQPVSLASLRGRVVMLHTFQMLCPGCVAHALPQAERTHRLLGPQGLVVLGLHTVFEHHAAMNDGALEAFIHEYRWTFPIGVDEAVPGDALPRTMRAYAFQGTPSTVLIDAQQRIRLQHFGAVDDIALGAALGRLLQEARDTRHGAGTDTPGTRAGATGCPIDSDCG